MSTPSVEDIQSFLPFAPTHLLNTLEKLLEAIDCPENFRGLQKVHSLLEYLFNTHPNKFCEIFEIEINVVSQLLPLFSRVDDTFFSKYRNTTHAKGWMSRRPLYSLLFIFYEHQTPQAAEALLFFLNHYYANELKIISEDRTETSIRSFRLLYTDEMIDRRCFNSNSIDDTANQILQVREILMKQEHENDEESGSSSRVGYLRDLEHFYRLNWKKRKSFSRTSQRNIRSFYSRKKIERVIGSDNLFTASLIKRGLSKPLVDAGVSADEDYPELCIIKTEQPVLPKPRHELPDISVIKDKAKINNKNRGISKSVSRSHNITPLARNLLQPHELCHLWHGRNSSSTKLINKIPKTDIQCILHFILITGRNLNDVCNLAVHYNPSNDNLGLIVTASELILKIAPKPTAKRGKHSDNPNLLKNQIVTSITLPAYFYEMFMKSSLHGHTKFSGKPSVNAYRKAIESYLKQLNQRLHCQISLKRIENYLINNLIATEQHDPVILEILRGELSYYSRSPRHYAWYSETEINCRIQAIWLDMFNQMSGYDARIQIPELPVQQLDLDTTGIGSQFTPTRAAIKDWVNHHLAHLKQFTAFDVVKNLRSLIDYHNQYTAYTLIMLVNASGYRAVYNPLPSFDLLLLRHHALCISDKDSSKTFSHTRVVVCPTVLKSQLIHYQQHMKTLANLINHLYPAQSAQLYAQTCDHQLIDLPHKNDRIEWFLTAKNSQANDGLFFLFIQDKDDPTFFRTKNSGPSYLSKYIDLPLNFGRHYVRRYLQLSNIHQELIKFQLGHWVNGETPLEKCSSLSHRVAINQLLPVLDMMLEELSWVPVPSLITRKRS